MNEAKARLNNYRQSPRKVRLVADTVRGRPVGASSETFKFGFGKCEKFIFTYRRSDY